MAQAKKTDKQPKAIASTQSLSSFVKTICDVMRRPNCASALQYVPELTWILFLPVANALARLNVLMAASETSD